MTKDLTTTNNKSLARIISVIENETAGYEEILQSLQPDPGIPVIGITGPPGAGKSTLISALLKELTSDEKKYLKGKGAAVLTVDPTSPFSQGALLGDRLRMAGHFNHPKVFIRSLATRGSLGGLSAKTMEITDILRSSGFNFIFIETVGVGQSEIEIASLADTTVLVLVPESGDDVQAIKSGIMEVADILVINKSDHDEADKLKGFLKSSLRLRVTGDRGRVTEDERQDWEIPVIKTVATQGTGVDELLKQVIAHHRITDKAKNQRLVFEKSLRLIRDYKLKEIDKDDLQKKLKKELTKNGFNIYDFVKNYIKASS